MGAMNSFEEAATIHLCICLFLSGSGISLSVICFPSQLRKALSGPSTHSFQPYFFLPHQSKKLLSVLISTMHPELRKYPQGWSVSLRSLWSLLWQETHPLCDFRTPLPDYSHCSTLGFIGTGTSVRPCTLENWCVPIFLAWSYTVSWEGLWYCRVFSQGDPDPFDPWAMGGEG